MTVLVLSLIIFLLVAWAEWRKVRRKKDDAAAIAREQTDAHTRHVMAEDANRAAIVPANTPHKRYTLELRDGSTIFIGKPLYRISYIDFYGERTQRELRLLDHGASESTFQAFCFLREAERTFMFESVVHFVELGTEAIIPIAEVWSALHKGRAPPPYLQYQRSSRVADALVCFARDELGGVKSKIRPIILDALRKAAGDTSPDDAVLNKIINRRSRSGNVKRACAFMDRADQDIALMAALDMVRATWRKPDPELLAKADELFA